MALFGKHSPQHEERIVRLQQWIQARSPYPVLSSFLGLIAVVDFFTLILGIILGVAAITLGIMGLRDLDATPGSAAAGPPGTPGRPGRGLCKLGITLGSLAIALSLVMAKVYGLQAK